ncbi:hypothetical protein NX059_003151 [Plenodomus lindquistii]|nr:hypothetical protein NX059_003151 [Plenodomus lindquistii]
MWEFKAISILAFIASNISFVKGADCDLNQPRKEGDPSGTDIASFLSGALNDPNGIICAGWFPPLNNNIATYNANSMLFNVTREDATKPIENCNEAFSNIIEQCIQNGNYWGGVWSLNGFTYTIADVVFPKNGIQGPEGSGSPTTAPPSTSIVLIKADLAGNVVTLTSTSGDPGVSTTGSPTSTMQSTSGDPDVSTTGSPTSTMQSTSSSSSVAPVPTVDGIGDPPLPDFQQIIGVEPSGPLPDDPVDPTTSSAPAATPTPSNTP